MDENLERLKPIYFPNECDISKELFYPCAKSSSSFDCMSGYFSSEVLSELALPLSIFYSNKNSKSRILISPSLSPKDRDALIEASRENFDMMPMIFGDVEVSEENLKTKALEILKVLIASGRLELRIVLMNKGMFHAKAWIFEVENDSVAIHGSSNATQNGLLNNFEQISVARSWTSKDSSDTCNELRTKFMSFWESKREDSKTIKINEKTRQVIKSLSKKTKAKDIADNLIAELEDLIVNERIKVPMWLDYKDGEYSHQYEAIKSWLINKNGILAIATGGGKTLTSLVCSSIALSSKEKGLLVISVPKKPLIDQWEDDVKSFGVKPVNTSGIGTKNIIKELGSIKSKLRYTKGHVCIILTHDALKEKSIQDAIEKVKCVKMLIADEAHNLGTESFIKKPPTIFDYKLGLSATPERQYDEEGSDKLISYFGGIVYEFSIKEAIGKCLVPFNYFPIKVNLTADEADQWLELTEKIKRLSWKNGEDGSNTAVEKLLIARRRILETATNKAEIFKEHYARSKNKDKTLVFCTDKDPHQLKDINEYLYENGVNFHQVTADETRNNETIRSIKAAFSDGSLSVLTSKRVLDEGFNVPQIENAYILASNTVKRQWIQRLGRVLRLSKATGKKYANIYDFVTIPPLCNDGDEDLIKVLYAEFERIKFFSEVAMNAASKDGGLDLMQEIIDQVEEYERKL